MKPTNDSGFEIPESKDAWVSGGDRKALMNNDGKVQGS